MQWLWNIFWSLPAIFQVNPRQKLITSEGNLFKLGKRLKLSILIYNQALLPLSLSLCIFETEILVLWPYIQTYSMHTHWGIGPPVLPGGRGGSRGRGGRGWCVLVGIILTGYKRRGPIVGIRMTDCKHWGPRVWNSSAWLEALRSIYGNSSDWLEALRYN